ncbi:DUF4129 domain-containing protein [Haladaptatus sp. DJG-WS-42]|uniref:DUF4129 domain-containing protein n=1 Tax=Haladaptatus sp. DJG-WS-42 TaxID=3120516 RepID=UPI0030CE4B87
MDTDRLLSAVVAVLCILSVGFASTTLDDSVETKPEDVINIDYDKLPINPQEAEEFKGDSVTTADPESTGTPSTESKTETQGQTATPGEGNEELSDPQSGAENQQTQTSGQGSSPRLIEESLLDKLLSLLMTLLPFVLIGAVLAVAVKKRETIAGWLETAERNDPVSTQPTVVARPENEVYHAWHEVASAIPYERRKAMTPDEVAAALRDETELKDELLMELTKTFKRIRYGGAPVTDDDRALAARVEDQLNAQRVAEQ